MPRRGPSAADRGADRAAGPTGAGRFTGSAGAVAPGWAVAPQHPARARPRPGVGLCSCPRRGRDRRRTGPSCPPGARPAAGGRGLVRRSRARNARRPGSAGAAVRCGARRAGMDHRHQPVLPASAGRTHSGHRCRDRRLLRRRVERDQPHDHPACTRRGGRPRGAARRPGPARGDGPAADHPVISYPADRRDGPRPGGSPGRPARRGDGRQWHISHRERGRRWPDMGAAPAPAILRPAAS